LLHFIDKNTIAKQTLQTGTEKKERRIPTFFYIISAPPHASKATLEIPLKPPILQPPRGCKIFLLVLAKPSSSWLQNGHPAHPGSLIQSHVLKISKYCNIK